MRVFALGGVPCSGKTTIANRFIMRNMQDAIPFKFKKVEGLFKGDLVVVGIYDDTRIFSGTDRLSMAVQPDFFVWLNQMKEINHNANIFFEGDRLFTTSVLKFMADAGIPYEAVVLDLKEKERLRRKESRGDAQTETFVTSRRTKYENILQTGQASRIFNETTQDTQYIVETLENFFGIK